MHATIMAALLSVAAPGGSVESFFIQRMWVRYLVDQNVLTQNVPPSPSAPGQSSPPPPATEGRATIPQAPIGHRQPTQRDIAPGGLRQERPLINDSYQPPSLCRNC
jgi:hypothetical protein